MRKIPFPLLVLTLVLTLAGCGQSSTGNQPSSPPANQQVNPAGGTTLSISGPAVTGKLIVEPQAGVTPYLTLVQQAEHSIDVNSYLLTDRDLVSALVRKARSGVDVRVIVAGNPYGDQNAVAREQAGFTGS
jgi:phosphatidylserine/phosphatidylglycerophosphate/cardiolipin synthase-like enzyme